MASPTSEQRDDLEAGCADGACPGSACALCRPVECECEDVCWICLDGSTSKDPLVQPCACPRLCHPKCIARWQLQSSGSRREKYCQFCEGELPCWRKTLTPDFAGLPASAPAVMNVNFEGRTFSFEVKSGADGYERFTASIKRSFRLPTESDLNITFTCDCPLTGQLLTLQGPGAYDAAVHCAAVSAAKRLSASAPAPSDPAGQPVIAWDPSVDADSDRDDVAAVNRESDARPAQLGSKRRLVFAVKKLRGVVASLLGAS